METKTKLGLSVTIMAAIACLMGLFGGYTALLLVAGYVLIFEKDAWLRQITAGVLLICLLFALLTAVLGLIPNVISIIREINDDVDYPALLINIINVITLILNFIEKILLLVLGIRAFCGKKDRVPVLGNFLEKHLSHPDKD